MTDYLWLSFNCIIANYRISPPNEALKIGLRRKCFEQKLSWCHFFANIVPDHHTKSPKILRWAFFFYSPWTVGRFAFFEEIWENPFTSPEGHMVLNNELFYRQHIKVGMIKGIPTLEIILKMIIWVILVKICPIFCVKRKNLGVHEI